MVYYPLNEAPSGHLILTIKEDGVDATLLSMFIPRDRDYFAIYFDDHQQYHHQI